MKAVPLWGLSLVRDGSVPLMKETTGAWIKRPRSWLDHAARPEGTPDI